MQEPFVKWPATNRHLKIMISRNLPFLCHNSNRLKVHAAPALFLILLVLSLTASLDLWPKLRAQKLKARAKIDVYIDPSDYFYYYYSFKYLNKALQFDDINSQIHSLSKLDRKLTSPYLTKDKEPKIYLIILYERSLEKYQETLDLLNSRHNMVLWIITAQGGGEFQFPPDFRLDATTSASSQSAFIQDFRNQILPRILTIYTDLL